MKGGDLGYSAKDLRGFRMRRSFGGYGGYGGRRSSMMGGTYGASRFKSSQNYMLGYNHEGDGYGGGRGGGGRLFVYQSDLNLRRGAGVASVFSNIYSSVVPHLKSALSVGTKAANSTAGQALADKVKQRAMRAGLNVVSDALSGKNVVQSTQNELQKAQRSVKKNAARNVSTAFSDHAARAESKKRQGGSLAKSGKSLFTKRVKKDLFDDFV